MEARLPGVLRSAGKGGQCLPSEIMGPFPSNLGVAFHTCTLHAFDLDWHSHGFLLNDANRQVGIQFLCRIEAIAASYRRQSDVIWPKAGKVTVVVLT